MSLFLFKAERIILGRHLFKNCIILELNLKLYGFFAITIQNYPISKYRRHYNNRTNKKQKEAVSQLETAFLCLKLAGFMGISYI